MSDIGQSGSTKPLFGDFVAPTKDQWKAQVERDLKGAEYQKLVWKTYEGFSVEPMYTSTETEALPHLGSLPGFEPYVRGTQALGFAARPWVIAQMTGPPLPDEAASEIVLARRCGQDGAALRMDRAAFLAAGTASAGKHAGRNGTSVQHLPDFKRISDRLQDGIPLEIHAGMSSLVFLAMAVASDRSLSHTGFNPLAQLMSTGELPFSLKTTFRLLRDAVRYVDHRSLNTTVISVCGECYHDAGANAVQELACMMASGVEYLNRLTDLGLSADAVARRVRFNIPVGMNFFMEIAKLRAARMLWYRITKDFGVQEEDARKMRAHVRTSWWHQTKYDPYVNMLRSTIEAMAGVIGGADSMYTAPFDEVAAEAGVFSKRVARNLQIVLREEAQLGRVADPAAGSYYMETLTNELAQHAWTLFTEIEQQGGYLAAASSGFIQESIEKTAKEKRSNISCRRDVIVGSNQYPNLGEKALTNSVRNKQEQQATLRESLQRHLATRSASTEEQTQSLRLALSGETGNLIAAMASALEAGATVAEINDLLHNGGEDVPIVRPLRPFRAAEDFEQLRDAVAALDRKPNVFLATYGPGLWRRARATFASGFFGTAGLAIVDNAGFDTPEDAATAAMDAGADILVACSDDESYADMVPRIIRSLRDAGSDMSVVVAGNPKDSIEALRTSGVEWFIHVKSDVGVVLREILQRFGIATEAGREVEK
ncbi:MAG: acyl-CoA mutase large subunit family protein [Bacteroidetes bacterium]|nr:acyl-CoA mutase large subunit family protein [Bacteroidota bacterium]